MDERIEIPNVNPDVTTPTFMVKILRNKSGGARRFHVWCLNKKYIPVNPENNNHFEFCKSHLEMKTYMDVMDNHIQKQKELETHQAPEPETPVQEAQPQGDTQTQPSADLEQALEKHEEEHKQIEQQEPAQPEQTQPAPEPQQEPQQQSGVPGHYVPIKRDET